MLIVVVSLLILLSVPLTGGRLSKLTKVRIVGGWVLIVALAAQIIVISIVPDAAHPVDAAVHVLTYIAPGWFLWRNRTLPGAWIIGLGGTLNGVPILLNGGILPASPAALARAGIHTADGTFTNSAALAHPILPWLGDVFAVPAPVPFANVFSVGDVLLLIGCAWALHRLSRTPNTELTAPVAV